MTQPINMTNNAAQQIKSLLAKAPQGTQGVRLNIKSTGCSGHSYAMEYIKPGETVDSDDAFTHDGATLYVPKIHSWMLFGLTVDYMVDNLGNAKFEFSNPNESGRCGCGESFHVDVNELKAQKAPAENVS